MSTDNFVKYLNYIKNKDKFDYLDATHFNNTVNHHYNSYFNPYKNDELYTKNFINSSTCFNVNKQFSDSLYSGNYNYELPTGWNKQFSDSLYSSEWKIIGHDIIPKSIEKIYKKTIDISVNNISDILKIIEENPYKEDTEYNIDLKALHNIKTELTELNNMIGMEKFKESLLNQILYFIQKLHVNDKCSDFKHTVIYGSPGTGKTEIAKLLGKMYSKIGVLNSKNNYVFKKVVRNDLIAGYLGQTAIKTRGVINECIGGVLFIDEAYSLGSVGDNDIFSNECIDILCEALSDHKDNLMVIIAGYEDELKNRFFSLNQGLNSRFIWRFKVDDYTYTDLMKIFKKKVDEIEWKFDSENVLNKKWFENKYSNFKNFGRDMENLLFYVKISHSRRVYGKDEGLRRMICQEDLENGYKMFLENNKPKENVKFHGLYV